MKSQKQILRSSAIIGAATVIGIILGVIRTKIAATYVGPEGIGMLGFLQNFVALAGAISALGIGQGGARDLASSKEDATGRNDAAATLWRGGLILAAIGATATVPIVLYADRRVDSGLGLGLTAILLAIAVAMTVVAGVQNGLLVGYRRIADIARLNVAGGVLALVLVALAFPFAPTVAVILFVAGAPVLTVAAGLWLLRGVPGVDGQFRATRFKHMVDTGLGLTASLLLAHTGALLVRGMIQDRFGAIELGLFQASWAVAALYLGLILNAMSADFFPRLSEHSADADAQTRLVNEQTEVLLLVGGPVILGMIGAAPFVVTLLYGTAFVEAAELLRLQLLGDVIKLLGWPLGFLLLSRSANRPFLVIEFLAFALFVAISWLLLDEIGVEAVGVAYGAMFIGGLFLSRLTVARLVPTFRWDRRVLIDASALIVAAAALAVYTPDTPLNALLIGAGVAALAGTYSLYRLSLHFPDALKRLRAALPLEGDR